MIGKIILITGATSGIGKETALALAKMGATILVGGRNPEKTRQTVLAIQNTAANERIEGYVADLSSMSQVRSLAAQINEKHPRLDILINNAGGFFARRYVTSDGMELTFALNHMSYFILTQCLMDVLLASNSARIINVSSEAHRSAQINFNDLHWEKNYNGWTAYSQSKLANILFTNELDRQLSTSHITANSLHPGFVATRFGYNNGPLVDLAMRIAHLFAISPQQGAQTLVFLASAPELEGVSGLYFSNLRPIPASDASSSFESAQRLWEISLHLGSLIENDRVPVSKS